MASGTNSTVPITTSSSILSTTSSSSRLITTAAPSTTSIAVVATTSSIKSSTTSNLDITSVTTASSAPPSTTIFTSIITTSGGSSIAPVTVVVTASASITSSSVVSSTTSAAATSSSSTSLQNNSSSNGSGGLSPTGRTAIAVVVPVVAVALLVLAALFFWRKRKQRKNAEEARRQEVEEYGYNPNTNPTIPAIASDGRSEMTEDATGGYRGWGTGGAAAARKASTTLSGGHTRGLSDAGETSGNLSTSPTAFGSSDGQHSDMYNHPGEQMTNDDLAALGAAPAAGANKPDVRRGPSNASSSYSAGRRSDHSDPSLGVYPSDAEPQNLSQSYTAYNQSGPYGDGSYGGGDGMPVVRDVSARRNTRIEQAGGYQQGNSGIAQNF